MKKAILLSLLMLMPYLIFSQGLKPDKIYVDGNDTLFCWTFPKAKILAQEISHSYYSDELMLEFENRQDLSDSLLKCERNEKTILLKEKENYIQINQAREEQLRLSNEIIGSKNQEIKRLKKTSAIMTLVAILAGAIVIIK